MSLHAGEKGFITLQYMESKRRLLALACSHHKQPKERPSSDLSWENIQLSHQRPDFLDRHFLLHRRGGFIEIAIHRALQGACLGIGLQLVQPER